MEVAAMRWRITPDDVVLMPGPLYHNGPIVTAFPALMVGASVVLMAKFDAEETLALIEKHRVSWVYMVPTMMREAVIAIVDDRKARAAIKALEDVDIDLMATETYLEWL